MDLHEFGFTRGRMKTGGGGGGDAVEGVHLYMPCCAPPHC